mmetsp:Transcript_27612/g.82342  ORF Transcript_27612/g.82342 Transcript_27612/m.82342 type:complete len:103 (-) Transcript_27612:168-476(-)
MPKDAAAEEDGLDDEANTPRPAHEAAPGERLEADGRKDLESEVAALIAKARSRLEGVRTVMEDNGAKLKTLQNGFKVLKKQQANAAREQQQSIGQLMNGLHS